MSDKVRDLKAAEILRASLQMKQAALALKDPQARREALKDYYFPPKSEPYVYAMLILNWFIAAGFATAIVLSFKESVQIWRLALCFPVALFIADFMSACFHKWLDSYASESNYNWGTSALAFRIHHQYPTNLNETTYLHNVSAFAPFLTRLFGVYLVLQFFLYSHPYANLTTFLIMQLFANGTEIHKQAHKAKPYLWIRPLQKLGIFLNKSAHIKHHSSTLDSDYGIINGWSNGILKMTGVWPALDLYLWKKLRVFPRNWVQAPEEIPESVMNELKANPLLVPLDLLVYEEIYPERTNFLSLSTTAGSRLSALQRGDELPPRELRA